MSVRDLIGQGLVAPCDDEGEVNFLNDEITNIREMGTLNDVDFCALRDNLSYQGAKKLHPMGPSSRFEVVLSNNEDRLENADYQALEVPFAEVAAYDHTMPQVGKDPKATLSECLHEVLAAIKRCVTSFLARVR